MSGSVLSRGFHFVRPQFNFTLTMNSPLPVTSSHVLCNSCILIVSSFPLLLDTLWSCSPLLFFFLLLSSLLLPYPLLSSSALSCPPPLSPSTLYPLLSQLSALLSPPLLSSPLLRIRLEEARWWGQFIHGEKLAFDEFPNAPVSSWTLFHIKMRYRHFRNVDLSYMWSLGALSKVMTSLEL